MHKNTQTNNTRKYTHTHKQTNNSHACTQISNTHKHTNKKTSNTHMQVCTQTHSLAHIQAHTNRQIDR